MTTRTKQVALDLVEPDDVIQIEPMNDISAEALLEKKLGQHIDKDGIDALAKELEYMPLALVQAAAYIRQEAPRCSVLQYLQKFRRNEKSKTTLLDVRHKAGHLRRDREAKSSILITWQISFDHIRDMNGGSAADLLSLMSFFDHEGIPKSLLVQTDESQIANENDSEASIEERFEEDLRTLRDFCFVSLTTDLDMFQMHSLVQLAMRDWLKIQGRHEQWKVRSIMALCRKFPGDPYEDPITSRLYFPHAQSAVAHKPKDVAPQRRWAILLHGAWKFGEMVASFTVAEEIIGKATIVIQAWLSEGSSQSESVLILDLMSALARSKSLKNQWRETEALCEQIVALSHNTQNLTDLNIMGYIQNVSSIYWRHGHAQNDLDRQIVEIGERLCENGAEQNEPIILSIMAGAWYRRKSYATSEKLYRRVLGIYFELYGLNSYYTLNAMSSLAYVLLEQGQWKEARKLLEVSSQRSNQLLGPEAFDSLKAKVSLAGSYFMEGLFKEAAELAVDVMKIRKRLFGPYKVDYLIDTMNVISIYIMLGKFKDAEELCRMAKEKMQTIFGLEHKDTLVASLQLACILWIQGRWKDAEEIELKTLDVTAKVFGPRDPLTLSAKALRFQRSKRWDFVEDLQNQAISKFADGGSHYFSQISIGKMAMFFHEQGRNADAISAMESFLRLIGHPIGCMHPDLFAYFLLLEQWRS
ncbi:hypothetical protein N0V90_001246 [Kalmusia sp. IMI 367209]|nr:hypothetical protein N0V90_001246 [Kalmusia sp. IMI 367209]